MGIIMRLVYCAWEILVTRTASFGLALEIGSQGSHRCEVSVCGGLFQMEYAIRIEALVVMTIRSSYILSCFGAMERRFFTRGLDVC